MPFVFLFEYGTDHASVDPVGFETGGRKYSVSFVDASQTTPAVIRILI